MRISLLIASLLLAGCTAVPDPPPVIPLPVSWSYEEGSFQLDRRTAIEGDLADESVARTAEYLKEVLDSATGFDLPVGPAEGEKRAITLRLRPDTAAFHHPEGYTLQADTGRVTIEAATGAGLFYGVQTLLQLFPPQVYRTDYSLVPADTRWEIPAIAITDYPRYDYRGMHLDVARHFFPVSFVKRYLDLMAMHKMNRFHWHLTEDQGWRIEIKKYPRLTEVGAWRDSTLVGHYGSGVYDRERYGGFYTQEEVREIVAYAAERHITVIPEIEMPGHSSAALAAYPQFGCIEGKAYRVQTTWGVFEDIFCPREETFTFLEDVLTEVMELFPGTYIHIGGDEAPKKQWEESALAQQVMEREGLADEHELQSWFIQRIEAFLNRHRRQIIGWDEILEGGLAPNATVMSWRGTEGGIEAARQGHNVVMTPGSHLYLDHYQAGRETEPLAIGGHTTLEKTYSYEPTPEELSPEEAQYILGAQGNVWTEYMHSGRKVEYMAWPRASALSEVVWSPEKDWDGFLHRMQVHFHRFDALNVNAAQHYRER